MRLPRITAFLALGVLVTSCYKDKIDPDMLNQLQFSPELEIPLVNATLQLADIVEKDTTGIFMVDNGFITIKYREDNLFELAPNDFVTIPDQDPQEFPIVVGQPPVLLDMALGTIAGAELAQTKFFKGSMELILESDSALSDDVEVKLTINNAQVGSQDLNHNLTLSSGNLQVIDSIDLSNVIFDFSNGGQNVNYISVGIELVNPPAALMGKILNYSVQFKSLELDYTTGYFGDRLQNIPAGDFTFDLSGIEQLASGFRVAHPDIKVLIASNVGVEVEATLDMDGINAANVSTPLDATPQTIVAATDTVGFDTSIISFNTSNSNIANFIAALPSNILYSGTAELNPSGKTNTNFIGRNAALTASIDIELPLEISIDNSMLEQELTGVDIFGDNPDEIEEFTLIFRSSNGFPFQLDLSAAFLEKNTQDSIFGFNLGLLDSATTDANGNILSRGEYDVPREVTFSGTDLNKLKRSDAIRFTAIINTPGTAPKKFYTHFDTQISIAARVQLKAKL